MKDLNLKHEYDRVPFRQLKTGSLFILEVPPEEIYGKINDQEVICLNKKEVIGIQDQSVIPVDIIGGEVQILPPQEGLL